MQQSNNEEGEKNLPAKEKIKLITFKDKKTAIYNQKHKTTNE